MLSEDPDITLIKCVLEGKTEAFSILSQRYGGMIFALVMGIVRQREEAEEIAQDTFIKAFKNLGKYRGTCSFSTWLYRIGYNTAISHIRKKHPHTVEIEEHRFCGESDADNEDFIEEGFRAASKEKRYDDLDKALGLLENDERAIITLFYTEDKSICDIALITGLNVPNVKVKLHRTRKKLYLLMNKDYE